MSLSLEQVQAVIGRKLPPIRYEVTPKNVILYALGVGAPSNWLDRDELRFVYELHPDGLRVLPTFAVIYSSSLIDMLISGDIGGIKFNPMMLVHGEQVLELKKLLPSSGIITCEPQISGIYDKGSGMLMTTDVRCTDEQGEEVAFTQASMFIRGLGGFGGERGETFSVEMPDRAPDAVQEEQTLDRQALIYRLSGDINPLHADPAMAALGNFDRPILHGLSTFGFAGRAILKHFCSNDPARFAGMRVRFSKHVFPGETLITEMWQTDQGVVFQTRVKEREAVVLSNALATLR